MTARLSILCTSLGLLMATAVPLPNRFSAASRPAPSSGDTSFPSSCPAPHTATSDTTSFSRLSSAYAPADAPIDTVASPVDIEPPTLWLARAIYSETKLPHEQELVAWVVRNRVDTRYRGKSTYRDVVLDPYQFSAFNPGSPKRSYLTQLTPDTPFPGWQQALWVAYYVRHADPIYRPFSIETRHFYSERSMEDRQTPYWAESSLFVSPSAPRYVIDEERFRFYKQIS